MAAGKALSSAGRGVNLIGDPRKDGCAVDPLSLCGSLLPVLKQEVA
jgi:hypothetical protein